MTERRSWHEITFDKTSRADRITPKTTRSAPTTKESTLNETITCPSCGATEGKVTLEGTADVTYTETVYAEIDLAADLTAEKVCHNGYVPLPRRYLSTFRYESTVGRIDQIDHRNLQLDEDEMTAFCWACQADVTTEFRAVLDRLHPKGGS